MDKANSSKGVIKVMKHEKQVSSYTRCCSLDKDRNIFKVEKNDFPSLSEVHEKNPKSEKDSSTYSVSSFTYSSKLKTLPAECSLQNMTFQNLRHFEPKAESVSSKGPSKKEPSLNEACSAKHMANAFQSNHDILTKQSSSAVYNTVPSSNKKSKNFKLNSSFSESKNNKSECFNECTNMKPPYGKKSVNDNRSPKTAHGQSNTFEKTGHIFKKGHNLNNSTASIVQRFPISQSLSSPRKIEGEYSNALRCDMSFNKESDRPSINIQHKRLDESNRLSINTQHKRLDESNRPPCSWSGGGQGIHNKAHGNTLNKGRIVSNPGSQKTYNSVKPGNNKAGNQSSIAQSPLACPSETKKKRKRKSKLKRQAALQTGKILFLTPEVHSKIVSQSNNTCPQKHQNVFTNINDSEEYPELGLAESKTLKKSHATVTNVHTKEENTTNSIASGSEIAEKENRMVSEDSSVNENLEVTTKLDEKHNDLVEKPEGEKLTIHSNYPITLSLFDMLVTAKPRKKEPEKKDETTDENNTSAKIFKKEMIKKSVLQAVNPLASSRPTIKRGKEREKPKIKRPSRMRKLIVMEKQLKKETMTVRRLEAEDENKEKSEEILPRIHACHGIKEFSTCDNLETYDENLLNYGTNLENVKETCEIYDDVNNKTSEQFILNCEDGNFESTSKNQNLNEQSKLNNEIMNNVSQPFESHMANFCNNNSDFNIISDSIVNIQNDFVSNPASNLTDIGNNFEENLTDISKVEYLTKICSSAIRKFSEKYPELKDGINNSCCINEKLKENCVKTETICQTYNFMNTMQESDCKISDVTENIIPAITNINTDIDFNSGKESDSKEIKKSSENLDISRNILDISACPFSDQEKLKATKLMLHSRKFRQYCNHFISKEIDEAVYSLIDDLARFQDRLYQKDPVKAKIRRRLVYGIKEIKKHMKLKKVKGIIIATDIEDIKIEGGLNDSLKELISLAEAYHIPYVFSHRRFNLGKVCRKSAPVSCVGIFNYEGSEKNFKKMIELHEDSKHDYLEVTNKLASELTDDQVKELFEAEKESIFFLREVSQKILREKVYFIPEGYRNNETSGVLEKSTSAEFEDPNLNMADENSLSFIEECTEGLKNLNKDNNFLQPIETDMNTILVKYKVVKEC